MSSKKCWDRNRDKSMMKKKSEVLQKRRKVCCDFFGANFGAPILNIMMYMTRDNLLNFIRLNKNVYRIYNDVSLGSIERQRMMILNNEKEKIRDVSIDPLSSAHVNRLPKDFIRSYLEFEDGLLEFLGGDEKMVKILKCIFESGDFYMAGSGILYGLTKKFKNKEILYRNSDIDVFLIMEGTQKTVIFKKMMKKLKRLIHYDYVVVKYSDVVNVVPKDKELYRTIQFVMKDIKSVTDFLAFVDLDCTRSLYNGKKIFSTNETMLSFISKSNFIRKEKCFGRYFERRIEKYGKRGYTSVIKNIHPLRVMYDSWNPKDIKSYTNREERNKREFDMFHRSCDTEKLCEVADMYEENKLSYREALEIIEEEDFSYKKIRPCTYIQEGKKETCIYNSVGDFVNLDLSNQFWRGRFNPFELMSKFSIRSCYMCKKFRQFRENENCRNRPLCRKCSLINRKYVMMKKNLAGKLAIVTGCRIKIGYEVCLRLLRNGCKVIGTTRFVKDAKKRYLKEKDHKRWRYNLLLYPLDLKTGKLVIKFIEYVKRNFKKVDYLINNAAVTIRRPLEYYSTLIDAELSDKDPISTGEYFHFVAGMGRKKKKVSTGANLALVPYFKSQNQIRLHRDLIKETVFSVQSYLNEEDYESKGREDLFPKDRRDRFDEPLDLRKTNSWNRSLNELSSTEILEVQAVNNISPQLLLSGLFSNLVPNFKKKYENPSYVVNVTSDEGYFDPSRVKTNSHPHTNISKAGLNMLTRTSGRFMAQYGILINSVDTGWITSSNTVKIPMDPPLTVGDGAARILHPIFTDLRESGKLYRNYKVANW